MSWEDIPSGSHLGDLLSALVDDELIPDQARHVQAHLALCSACRAERDLTMEMKRLIAGLPAVQPPNPVVVGLATGGRRSRPMVWAGVAAAVVGLGLLSAPPPRHTVTPPMTQLVQVHAFSSGSDPVTQLAPVAVPASFTP